MSRVWIILTAPASALHRQCGRERRMGRYGGSYRITDHRIKKKFSKLESILDGDLDKLFKETSKIK